MTTFSQFPMIELPNGPIVALSRRLLRDRVQLPWATRTLWPDTHQQGQA
jgi:hypothetical protein